VLKTYRWPNSVAFPDEDVALVQIPQTERNATGRLRVREVLLEILCNWAEHPVELKESALGPIVPGFIRGRSIEVSLSYAGGDAWVAIRSNGSVGMDAVLVADAPDWEAVAELYLGDNAVQEIRDSEHRGCAFAERWAALEARYKLAKLPLREKSQPPQARIFTLRVGDLIICIAMSLAEEKCG
jgi:phosphopantetheinyl transferase